MIDPKNTLAPYIDGSGLVLSVGSAIILQSGASTSVPLTVIGLTANATNFVFFNSGTIQVNTSGFTSSVYPIATVTTGNNSITHVVDNRPDVTVGGSGLPATGTNGQILSVVTGVPAWSSSITNPNTGSSYFPVLPNPTATDGALLLDGSSGYIGMQASSGGTANTGGTVVLWTTTYPGGTASKHAAISDTANIVQMDTATGINIAGAIGLPVTITKNGGTVGVQVDSNGVLKVLGSGRIDLGPLPVYANNAAAIAGGLVVGAYYRTGGDPDLVCVVH